MCFTHHQRVDAIKVSRSNDIILSVYRLNLVMYTTLVLLTLHSQFCSLLSQLVPTTTFNQHKKNQESIVKLPQIAVRFLIQSLRWDSNPRLLHSYHYSFRYQLVCYVRRDIPFIITDNLRIYNRPVGDKPSYTNCLWSGAHLNHIEIQLDYIFTLQLFDLLPLSTLWLEKCIICKFQLRFLLSALYTLSIIS